MEIESILTIIIIALIIIALIVLFTLVPVALWLSAPAAGVKVSLLTLIGMRLRRVVPARVINPLLTAYKAALDITTSQIESHYLAGGNLTRQVTEQLRTREA